MDNNIVLLTGDSASWKTTLLEVLYERGWKRVINFTTRKPRSDEELDDYVFITKDQFETKLKNGDFLENVEYNWNYYAISKFIPEWDIAIIVEPNWRKQIMEAHKEWKLAWKLTTYFLSVDKELQRERLTRRWDDPVDIEKRMKDNFKPTETCIILNWAEDTKLLATLIENNNGKWEI